MPRIPAVAAILSLAATGGALGASFAFGASQTSVETNGTVSMSQTDDDGVVHSQSGPGILQQSSGRRGSLSVAAVGRPIAGHRFALDVAGGSHTCTASISGAGIAPTVASRAAKRTRRVKGKKRHRRSSPRSAGCEWNIPSDAAGKEFTVAVSGDGGSSQMSFPIR